ncbi:hypothetical protein M409DRAFT_54049 [Zasmidium cellare ATCC 36951]|uniref:Uncharacterized protein n=1 Tax=Zasmidium cellare ATCC 36951 TaxID=1080233 RepID=A0A6A6CK80_ZASCE|nr:uncharacterized protein M409DRAFT_54049 [Zasmidium cellare ATCC 36951]KAF2167451.1 hypothetical protein M409DRAFT_54049 [Zasmidium cellare ATCC 36951]
MAKGLRSHIHKETKLVKVLYRYNDRTVRKRSTTSARLNNTTVAVSGGTGGGSLVLWAFRLAGGGVSWRWRNERRGRTRVAEWSDWTVAHVFGHVVLRQQSRPPQPIAFLVCCFSPCPDAVGIIYAGGEEGPGGKGPSIETSDGDERHQGRSARVAHVWAAPTPGKHATNAASLIRGGNPGESHQGS